MYAYGKDCGATFFTLRVAKDTSAMRKKMAIKDRLAAMQVASCATYATALKVSGVLLSLL